MLDDAALRARVDAGGFWRLIAELPAQARAARELGRRWPLPDGFARPERVVVLGVGGSAIGADVVAALAARLGPAPVEVVRDYEAPPPGAGTLLVACSFSGETEEVLTAFAARLGGPGMRLALTTGGRLAALARERGVPLLEYRYGGPPRAAFGYGVLPLAEVLRRLGALAIGEADVDRALLGLERAAAKWGPGRPAAENPAKRIAERLHGRLPVVLGAGAFAPAARRWAGQLAENAKQWAFALELPEAGHNAVVALERRQDAERALRAVILDGPAAHPRNRARAQLIAAELDAAGVGREPVAVEAADPLGAALEACCLGDWVSYYAALLHGADPRPTPILDRARAALAARPARDPGAPPPPVAGGAIG